MKVSVKMNNSAIRALFNAQVEAMVMTADQMLVEIKQDAVVPFDTGNLQDGNTFVDDSKKNSGQTSIAADTPYAARLYFNPQFNFRMDKNANARGEWWEEWLSGNKRERPTTLYREYFRRKAGVYLR